MAVCAWTLSAFNDEFKAVGAAFLFPAAAATVLFHDMCCSRSGYSPGAVRFAGIVLITGGVVKVLAGVALFATAEGKWEVDSWFGVLFDSGTLVAYVVLAALLIVSGMSDACVGVGPQLRRSTAGRRRLNGDGAEA